VIHCAAPALFVYGSVLSAQGKSAESVFTRGTFEVIHESLVLVS